MFTDAEFSKTGGESIYCTQKFNTVSKAMQGMDKNPCNAFGESFLQTHSVKDLEY